MTLRWWGNLVNCTDVVAIQKHSMFLNGQKREWVEIRATNRSIIVVC